MTPEKKHTISPEDIKVGETYNVRVKVKEVRNNFFFTVAVDRYGNELNEAGATFIPCELLAFSPLPPSELPTLVGPAPKHDPRRLFRKGDIVRLREYNGRPPYDYWHKQVIKNFGAKLDTVLEDEKDSGNVDIFQDAPIDELTVRVNSCHLELVTPAEEMEPYYAKESHYKDEWQVWRRDAHNIDTLMSTYACSHPHAKDSAEAERDRLNAEHRKEHEND